MQIIRKIRDNLEPRDSAERRGEEKTENAVLEARFSLSGRRRRGGPERSRAYAMTKETCRVT